MNVTSKEKQVMVLKALVEGNSIRSIERMLDIHRDTIMRLMVRVGEKCKTLMDKRLRGFHCKYIEIDEIWSFVLKKQGRLTEKEKLNREIGDQYIFVALDAETKLIPSFTVGKRDTGTTLGIYSRLIR